MKRTGFTKLAGLASLAIGAAMLAPAAFAQDAAPALDSGDTAWC